MTTSCDHCEHRTPTVTIWDTCGDCDGTGDMSPGHLVGCDCCAGEGEIIDMVLCQPCANAWETWLGGDAR
jgi:DnaJ-class molecular chaperone